MKINIGQVICREKVFALDRKPFRLEIYSNSTGFTSHIPMYFTSFETLSDCEKTKELIHKFKTMAETTDFEVSVTSNKQTNDNNNNDNLN